MVPRKHLLSTESECLCNNQSKVLLLTLPFFTFHALSLESRHILSNLKNLFFSFYTPHNSRTTPNPKPIPYTHYLSTPTASISLPFSQKKTPTLPPSPSSLTNNTIEVTSLALSQPPPLSLSVHTHLSISLSLSLSLLPLSLSPPHSVYIKRSICSNFVSFILFSHSFSSLINYGPTFKFDMDFSHQFKKLIN